MKNSHEITIFFGEIPEIPAIFGETEPWEPWTSDGPSS